MPTFVVALHAVFDLAALQRLGAVVYRLTVALVLD
jgi:hypothetical protein